MGDKTVCIEISSLTETFVLVVIMLMNDTRGKVIRYDQKSRAVEMRTNEDKYLSDIISSVFTPGGSKFKK